MSARSPRHVTGRPHAALASLGAYGERVACRHLTQLGMRILDVNWRCEFGEIDIVALDGSCLVVCEVKTRRTDAFGTPIESITVHKLARLRRLAATWLARHEGGYDDVRVDVVGVTRPRSGPAVIEHLTAVA